MEHHFHHFPKGTIETHNPSNNHGLIIILGQFMDGDPDVPIHDNMHINLAETFQNSSSNVLYINLNDRYVPLHALQETVGIFAAKHQNISVITAMHGFQVLPGAAHESLYKPQLSFGAQYLSADIVEAASYLLGSYIKSEDFIRAIAGAVGNKPIELWHSACQGNKLIPQMQETLPKGSTVHTDTTGFSNAPEFLISALVRTLQSAQPFNLDLLFKHYSHVGSDAKYLESLNLDPIKTIIGGHSTNLAQLADVELIANLSKLKSSYCNNQPAECSDNVDLLGRLLAEGKTVSSCTTHQAEHSWLAHAITSMMSEDTRYSIPEKCVEKYNPGLYMTAIGLAAENIAHGDNLA